MKKIIGTLLITLMPLAMIQAQQLQTPEGFIPSNRTMSASLEKNILFNATTRYTVTQSGLQVYTANQLSKLFDGSMEVMYTLGIPVTSDNPLVIEIDNLPNIHTQVGAWIGFSTRGWPAKKFRVEGWESWHTNNWITFAEVDNNIESQYVVKTVPGVFTKLKLTFYEGNPNSEAPAGQMGLSELYFIHPEAAQAYDGLLLKENTEGKVGIGTTTPTAKLTVTDNNKAGLFALFGGIVSGNYNYTQQYIGQEEAAGKCGNIGYMTHQTNPMSSGFYLTNYGDAEGTTGLFVKKGGFVGIATTTPDQALTVKGKIHAEEVIVDLNVPLADYVFNSEYPLMPLHKVESYVKTNNRLPDMPSADEVKSKGLNMGEMQNKLLQKIEELTLYVIELKKTTDTQNEEIKQLKLQLKK